MQKIQKFKFLRMVPVNKDSYGEVELVRNAKTNKIYGMKIVEKELYLPETFHDPDSPFFYEERQKLAANLNSDWFVQMEYVFHNLEVMYMVTEYMPGGDLMNLITNYEASEKWTRFYTAELIEALDALHKMGYIHRDVKPENTFISRSGHLKLADYGMSVRMKENGMVRCSRIFDTPEFLAPEIARDRSQYLYCGVEVDWWAVGVFIYEMLYKKSPFYDELIYEVLENIDAHESILDFPYGIEVSESAKDIIKRFLSEAPERLGKNGVDEIRKHKFFENDEWNFENLRLATPPIIPNDDKPHFEEIEDFEMFQLQPNLEGNRITHLGFACFNPNNPVRDIKNTFDEVLHLNDVPKKNDPNQEFDEILVELKANREEIIRLKENLKTANIQIKSIEEERNLLSMKIIELERKLSYGKEMDREGE